MTGRPVRVVAAAAALALGASTLGVAGVGAQQRASLPDIEDEVMCTICGTLLETSQSPQADRERELIRRLIDQGRSKEEIKDALVAEYGEEVLAVPDSGGFDLAAWVVPAAALAAAIAALALALRAVRRRSRTDGGPAPALSPEEEARLRADLSRYEL